MGSGVFLERLDPGQEVILLWDFYSDAEIQYWTSLKETTAIKLEGAKLIPGANFWRPDGKTATFIESLPYSFPLWAMLLRVKVNDLGKDGKPKPVRLTVRTRVNFVDNPYTEAVEKTRSFDETVTVEIPVSKLPVLELESTVETPSGTEMKPGGSARMRYRAHMGGKSFSNLTFVAQIPKGTSLVPNSALPTPSAVSDGRVTWNVAGPITDFRPMLDLRVKERPGVKKTEAKFSGRVQFGEFFRRNSGSRMLKIKNFDRGRIDYQGEAGTNSEVEVGKTYPFWCSDWDKEGGDITVALNDVGVTTVPFSNPNGSFEIPPFRDPDLEHILSARQKGKPSDTAVKGRVAAVTEYAQGKVLVVDGAGAKLRKLKSGREIAVGEMDFAMGDVGQANQFGLVRFANAAAAGVIRFLPEPGLPSDARLLYARGGDVAIFGGVQVRRLRLGTADGVKSLLFDGAGGGFADYDPAGLPGVTTLVAGGSIESAPGSPSVIAGFHRCGGNFTFNGPVTLQGALLFVDGNLVINGDVVGDGTIITTGNCTIRGKAQWKAGTLVLGVGGTFSALP